MNPPDVRCVLLADGHTVLVDGVRGLLNTMFDTVVMVADVKSLLDTVGKLNPGVSVVDISLAGSSNLDWLKQLRRNCPETRLVLLSVYDEPRVIEAAKEAGADAVVVKNRISTELLPTLEQVLGETRHSS
jgi:DNA-binding NarL/FixJ family response regulator